VQPLSIMEWKLIHTAPFDRDLELAVIDRGRMQIVGFRCRRLSDNGWLDVETDKQVYHLSPTHWRDWPRN
jgi:hypothetical protein